MFILHRLYNIILYLKKTLNVPGFTDKNDLHIIFVCLLTLSNTCVVFFNI